MADLVGEKLSVILDASQGCKASTEGQLRWLGEGLVVARGPEEVESTEVESAWEVVSARLPQRGLLHMGGPGWSFGGGLVLDVCAFDLPGGGSIYTLDYVVSDGVEQTTSVIALSEVNDAEVDARVVELSLSVEDPRGLNLGIAAFGGMELEMSTTLPRDRAVPVLAEALTQVDLDADEDMAELVAEASENLDPWGPEWKAWLVGEYLGPFLPDP